MRIFRSLKFALVMLFAFFTAGMTANFILLTRVGVERLKFTESGVSPIEASALAQNCLEERFENLAAKAMALAESPVLKSALDSAQPSTAQVVDVARELAPAVNASLLVVTDPAGAPLFDSRINGAPKNPASWGFVDKPLKGSAERSYFMEGGQLVQAVAVPVQVPGKVLGAVAVGFPVDASVAAQWKSLTGNDAALMASGKCLALTEQNRSPSQAETELAPFLPGGAQVSPSSPNIIRMQSKDASKQDASREGCYINLSGPDTNPVGSVFFVRSIAKSPDIPLWPFIAAGTLWFVLGLAFAVAASRLASRPLARIQKAVEEAEGGNWKSEAEVPEGHEAAPLARSLNRFLSHLQETELIKNILGKHAPQSVVKKLLATGEPPSLQGERRETVVLFCGIRGFSTFSENADPVKLSKGLNEFFTLMANIVFKHEGMLDKFVGDTFLAVWGVPLAQEDAEMKAVEAALEMQEVLKDFNAERVRQNLHPMMVGIGIASGEVVAGNLGSEQNPDYTVIGDEVSLALKLSQKASAGQIVLTDPAYQKVKDRVEVNPLAPIVQKGIAARGFTDPIKIHVVTDLKSDGNS